MSGQIPTIHLVVVNHNTSDFTELAARSFYAMHGERETVRFTIMDNSSQDGTGELEAYARDTGIEFRQSGFVASQQQVSSHGEVLRLFVMENPNCDFYLLLDADVCFIKPNTIDTLVREIGERDELWAAQARSRRTTARLFGQARKPVKQDVTEYRSQKWVDRRKVYLHGPMNPRRMAGPSEPCSFNHRELDEEGRRQPLKTLAGSIKPRCEPCCTLVRNTALFRRVADRIGFSPAWILENAVEGAGVYDVMGLMTAVMTTHQRVYLESSAGVLHFWKVSYGLGDPSVNAKSGQCQKLLEQFRQDEIPDFDGDEWMTPEYLAWVMHREGYLGKGEFQPSGTAIT